ncbi:DNA-3-methyladenine glycosylase I [Kushneria phosphatilytica]|uniref:DNA-3-methyladenine glycosylase I n=1 Tax=Kushneria phosphatilytica TaxID=657387 RepID=A0A1S1NYF0_9GAMM|nr:DNA-3-methyladenine glycosylase I [Kushneria phosphatilytica]OHV12772.1 DNA-3-methyladenine glycosylase [Kushneria phosphatilytica]QEL10615.1 DNA-3-methyladenine glycosylase I [Kushneria phosphatilytica]
MVTDECRCRWAQGNALLAEYHDHEWGVPEYDDRALWEKLMLDGFQAGLSWLTVLRKREAFRECFAGFEPERVAQFEEPDVQKLLEDARIIRSRAKIEATIGNARAYLAMRDQGEPFGAFVWQMIGHRPIQNEGPVPTQTALSKELSQALKRRGFRFVGPTIVYAWMQAVGMVNDHAEHCWRRQPVASMADRC